MRILVTGGAGFIGSNLCQRLYKKNIITVIDNLNSQIHGDKKNSPTYNAVKNITNFVYGDVRDAKLIKKIIKNQDVIIHLAAETGTGQSMYEIEKYTDININGTACILNALVNESNQVKKIILSSSRAIYGEGKYKCDIHGIVYPGHRLEKKLLEGDFEVKCPICGCTVKPLATDENSNLNPESVYAVTKLAQEQLTKITCNSIKLPYTILRFQNVYGPGQSLKNPYTGILAIFSNNFRLNKDINVFEDGLETRDFVYIDDITKSVELSIKNRSDLILNIGTGKKSSILQIAKLFKKIYRSKSNILISGNFRIGDIKNNFADIKMAKKEINYFPEINLENGLKKFAQWTLTQKINKNDKYRKSIIEIKRKGLLKTAII